MNAETLTCARCRKEVRIVRLNKTTLAFGHRQNPGPGHHMVRLARAARNGIPVPTELPEGPNSREDARPLRRMTNSTRAASNGSPRTSGPSEAPSPARAGRVAAGLPPAPAPRSARAG